MASTAATDDAASGNGTTGSEQPEVKPRYVRIALLGTSVAVTATAVLGGLGVLPNGGAASHAATQQAGGSSSAAAGAALSAAEQRGKAPRSTDAEPAPTGGADSDSAPDDSPAPEPTEEPTEEPAEEPDPDELLVPEDSGEGRRVVFDEGAQRVWLVKGDGSVARTYLVSGSIYDNLDPGTYAVFSRDTEAWGIDGSELRYMVRFTTGAEAAIGFHNIPVLNGKKVQTPDELGTALSHGCIRQQAGDARALWEFAPLGTTVVVVNTSPEVVDRSAES